MPDISVTPADIREAATRVSRIAHRTPVTTSRLFNEAAGVEAFFKCENLQVGGSFKMRGATNFVYSIPEADRARGVVAYSSGNHAQAVAIAAERLGIAATIVMPHDAPKSKVESTRVRGANVIVYNRFKESREAIGKRISEETGATLIPPFDHPWTIAGQGTAALELLEEAPDLDAMIVCISGGGFLSGCSIIAKDMRPAIRMFGVEPELANDFALSIEKGERVAVPDSPTIADGLRAPTPGVLTFPIVQSLVERILLVSEDEIRDAMRFLMTRLKLVVEPSGAVPAAAVLAGKLPSGVKRIGIMISGGNVDFDVLASLA